ncbi:Rv1476 family membrane protein [Mycolicibacterium brumae]|uniref:Uncharacterized protein n=1 Tax=Mycolicibacterium brumae TaxID=85968 RepID=A0A2G5PAQ4_9MYCO|nr:DUF6676 family protein [Mycolicibacterium brumae]MCV7193684.1 hypothetical protein [Mycolicibacterium brumae]PIB75073.1 hypothetical protein CQY22_010735 [Mycolicibacterium brumae]RWA17383.1 hypothetical protein MBRU_07075 [Mycolicibacterium brumae DSM 44177]UWW09043.1 hypothetical protein L2Z93_002128 [Mycolicibacterium brumae]
MTGPAHALTPPSFIPPELCLTVGVDPTREDSPAACMVAVQQDVTSKNYSARGLELDQVMGLRDTINDAKAKGIDLKVVVLDANPVIDTPLRDIANEVGQQHPGATVLVLSPSFVGTYSPSYDRVTLEAGEDLAKTGDAVTSTQNFVGQLQTPIFNWTALTAVLLIVVFAAAGLTWALRRAAAADGSAEKPTASTV